MEISSWNNRRGSILMVAVLFATLVAISVGSFLKLANHESRLSNIAFHSNSSLNLAEAGVELALYAMNHADWSDWSVSGTTATMAVKTLDLGENASGIIHARILSLNGNPIVQAEGKLELPNRPSVTKQVEVRLSRRSLFANGITSKRGVTFSGKNVTVDSYRSSVGRPSAVMVENNDNGSVASASVRTVDTVDVNNSSIFGYVSTGGPNPELGPHGRIFGKDTPSGVKADPNRIALDFAADFPEVDPPSSFHDYEHGIYGGVLGTPGAVNPTVYKIGNIGLSGKSLLKIVGPVVLHVTGSINVSGQAEIRVEENASAVIFVDGGVDIGGNGIMNATTIPANLLIYGTNRVSQNIKIAGNGALQAAVYAPNASVTINGNGEVSGAVVGDRVYLTGNAQFHYDEDLADFGSDGSYKMDNWRELHLAADRINF